MKIISTAALMMLCAGLYAQPQVEEGAAPPQKMTPEEIAKKKTDMMQKEVGLTDKQYKKVYKLVKKDQEYRQSQMEQRFSEGMPPMGGPGGGFSGGPGGMGGPGGGFSGGPGGMGGPGGGFSGGPGGMGGPGGGFSGGGMPPQGEMGQGQRPEGHPGMRPGADLVTEEYLEKQDQKLKKILTEDQYKQWRSKHPAEHLDLPPMEMDQPLQP